MNNKAIRAATDEAQIISHAGAALLAGLADKTALTGAIDDRLAGPQIRTRTHTPGPIFRNLAIMLAATGGDELDHLRCARSAARANAWTQGARPDKIVLDIDATLVTAHSDKEEAKGNWKGGYGHHPLLCYLDQTGEAHAGLLRPGNAGSNTASDHVEVMDMLFSST